MRFLSLNCGDLSHERILAWTEGECGALWSWRIRRHLSRCWACRTRVARFENAVASVQEELGSASLLDRRDVEIARWQFWQTVRNQSLDAAARSPRRIRPVLCAVALAGAALLCFFLFFRHHQSVPAATALASLQQIEISKFQTAIRQENYDIEISITGRPDIRRVWKRWSAPRQDLYKSVWSTENGQSRQTKISRAPQSEGGKKETDLTSAQANGIERIGLRRLPDQEFLVEALQPSFSQAGDMEAALLAWAGKQLWRPVSFAQEMAGFRTRTGSALRLTRTRDGMTLEAEQSVGGAQISMLLAVAPQTAAPRLLQVSWRKASQLRRVSIIRRSQITYSDFSLVAAEFAPGVSPVGRKPRQTELTPSRAPEISPEDLETLHVDVLLALHKLKLCTQDTVQVTVKGGTVEVEGFAADANLRSQLLEALNALPRRRFLRAHIQLPGPSHQPVSASQPKAGMQNEPAPVEAWLRQRFRGNRSVTERTLFDLMNRAVSASQQFSAQSAELTTLAEAFPAFRRSLLPPLAAARLLGMEKEHFSLVVAGLEQLRDIFSNLSPAQEGTTNADLGWWEYAATLNRSARSIADRTIDLFSSHAASGSLPPAPEIETEVSTLAAKISGALQLSRNMEANLDNEILERTAAVTNPSGQAEYIRPKQGAGP